MPPLPLFDTHCHLQSSRFDADREEVLARAADMRLLVPGCDLASSRAAVALAERHPNVYAAVGVHPSDCAGWAGPGELRELLAGAAPAAREKIRAIGETGLDFHWPEPGREAQERAFRDHLALAEEFSLPVVLHARDSAAAVLDLVEPFVRRGGRAVWHCYSGPKKELPALTACAVEITALESHRKGKPGKPDAWSNLDELTLVVPEGTFGNDQYRCQLTMKPTIQDAEIRVICEEAEVETAQVIKGKATYELDPKKFNDPKFFEKEATLYVRKQGDDKIKLTVDKKFHVWPVVQLELKAKKGLLRLDRNRNGARAAALTKDNHTEVALQVSPNGRVKSGKVTLDFVSGKNVVELRDSLNPNPNVFNLPVTWDVGGNGAAMPNIVHAVASENGVAKLSLTYDNGFGYKGEPNGASMKDAENETVALENIMVANINLMYQKVKAGVATPWQTVEDYNDDGEYEIFIRYYDDIKTKEEAVNGVDTSPLRVNLKFEGAPETMEVVWPEGVVTSRGTKGRAARCYFANACEMDATPVVKGSDVEIPLIVYVVKVEYEINAGTEYGFDAPFVNHLKDVDASMAQPDYATYISLSRDGKTSFDLLLQPELRKFNVLVKPTNADEGKLKLSSGNANRSSFLLVPALRRMPVTIYGVGTTSNRETAVLEVTVADAEGKSLLALVDSNGRVSRVANTTNRLFVDLYKQINFSINVFDCSREHELVDATILNNAFRQIVYRVTGITHHRPDSMTWDVNHDGILQFCFPGNNPEWASLLGISTGTTNPIFIVESLQSCYPITVREVLSSDANSSTIVVTKPYSQFSPSPKGYFLASIAPHGGVGQMLTNTNIVLRPNNASTYLMTISPPIAVTARSRLFLINNRTVAKSIPQKGVIISVGRGFRQYLHQNIVHEFSHLVAKLKDTKSRKIFYKNHQIDSFDVDFTIMQYNGGNITMPMVFRRRVVEFVQTSSGTSFQIAKYLSQWMEAER